MLRRQRPGRNVCDKYNLRCFPRSVRRTVAPATLIRATPNVCQPRRAAMGLDFDYKYVRGDSPTASSAAPRPCRCREGAAMSGPVLPVSGQVLGMIVTALQLRQLPIAGPRLADSRTAKRHSDG